ncbi:MMPL family transporter [Prolixibacter bellariivorans]|nr:MMPL family transporter [Prolixibacter bellariivorans]
MVNQIQEVGNQFEADTGVKVHYSGMPYIRVVTSQKIKREFLMFILAALAVVIIILFSFFRSFKAVILPVTVVLIGVIWTLG